MKKERHCYTYCYRASDGIKTAMFSANSDREAERIFQDTHSDDCTVLRIDKELTGGDFILREHRLSDVPTYALVDELKEREGVRVAILPPFSTAELKVEGPATVLDVFD